MTGADEADGRRRIAIGLMSGTSLDGIDAAVIETDGERVSAQGPALTLPYPPGFRERLRGLLGRTPDAGDQPVVDELTDRHADVVRRLLAESGRRAEEIDVVGFHGQTVLHRPERRLTVQVGDGQRLADALGIPVVVDFRIADVAAGGQGAPLAPLYHVALAAELPRPLAVLNIGGVANVTWIGPEGTPPLAFDTGPGNALLDDWMRARTGRPYDDGGELAAAGEPDRTRVMEWLRHPWFRRPPPKSLDRNAFAQVARAIAGFRDADGAATLCAFTARAVAIALFSLPEAPSRWLICGGGRHNPVLMRMIAECVGAPVEPVETVGWRGDSLEAEAFAFLAVRSLRGLPLTVPSTTGGPRPLPGGVVRLPGGTST